MSTVDHSGRLLTVRETAAALNVSLKTVRRLIDRGQIPAVRVGTSDHSPSRVSEGELNAWLHSYSEPEQ